MNNEHVDILMATYNGEEFIKEQIESILLQDHQNFKLIIRDDGSSDGTLSVIKQYIEKFPSRIELLPSKKNVGVILSFSILMNESKSDYILFSDQDDYWNKDKISQSLSMMKTLECKYPNTPLLIHTDLTVVDKNLKLKAPSFWHYSHLYPHKMKSLNHFLVQSAVTGCTMMINRPLLTLASPIPKLCVMHDSWLALVAITFGQVVTIPKTTLLYRQHKTNTVGAKKFLSFKYIQNAFDQSKKIEFLKYHQGLELFSRYFSLLNKKNKIILETYLKLYTFGILKRLFLIYNFQFFRLGLFRNILAIFFFRSFVVPENKD